MIRPANPPCIALLSAATAIVLALASSGVGWATEPSMSSGPSEPQTVHWVGTVKMSVTDNTTSGPTGADKATDVRNISRTEIFTLSGDQAPGVESIFLKGNVAANVSYDDVETMQEPPQSGLNCPPPPASKTTTSGSGRFSGPAQVTLEFHHPSGLSFGDYDITGSAVADPGFTTTTTSDSFVYCQPPLHGSSTSKGSITFPFDGHGFRDNPSTLTLTGHDVSRSGSATVTVDWNLDSGTPCPGTSQSMNAALVAAAPASCAPALTTTINKITPLPIADVGRQGNNSLYVSIPPPGSVNAFQRDFEVQYAVQDTTGDITNSASVTHATVDLTRDDGTPLQTAIVDEGAGPRVQVARPGLVHVQVTFSGATAHSTVGANPPPSQRIAYRFRISVKDDKSGATATSATAASGPLTALWHLPTVPRFGPCQDPPHDAEGPGGDGWVTKNTFTWIATHQNLLSRINDASFEHGLRLGTPQHQLHTTGVDFDMFHLAPLPGTNACAAAAGASYYAVLVGDMQRAFAGDATARAALATWVEQTRARLAPLLADPRVRFVIYARGALTPARGARQTVVTDGWAQDLLTTGAVTDHNGPTTGPPTPPLTITVAAPWIDRNKAKMRYLTSHDDHIHVELTNG
jgi:hypothetical protein